MSRGFVWENKNITQNINPKKLSTSDYNYNTKSGCYLLLLVSVELSKCLPNSLKMIYILINIQ